MNICDNEIYKLKHIETPRLLIRPIQLGDALEINKAIQNTLPLLEKWMPWAQSATLITTKKFVEYAVHCWHNPEQFNLPLVVIHKDDNKLISASGYNEHCIPAKNIYEIGYWIDADYQGQGLVTELTLALTRYAFIALKAQRTQLCIQTNNTKSIAVAKKCNYSKELIRVNDVIDNTSKQPADSYIYACYSLEQIPELDIKWINNEKTTLDINPTLPTDDNPDFKLLPPVYSCTTDIIDPSSPLIPLQTQRLELLPPELKDSESVCRHIKESINEIGPWFSWAKPDLSPEHVKHHIEQAEKAAKDIRHSDSFYYLVWHKEKQEIIGEVWCKLKDPHVPYFNIGYWFATNHCRHGYATEAVVRIIQFCQNDLKAKRLEIDVACKNTRSQKLAQRLEFTLEGKLKNYSKNFITGEIGDSYLYALTKD